MGMLTDFFVSPADIAADYEFALINEEDNTAFETYERREYKKLTSLELAQLRALLAHQPFSIDAHMLEVVSSEKHEGITEAFPDEFRDMLADIRAEQIPDLAKKWSAAIIEEINYSPTVLELVLSDLRDLAQIARNSGKGLYMWCNV